MKYVMGIDIGTSGCKTVVVDEHGAVAGSASKEYFATAGDVGYAGQNPLDWYHAMIGTFQEICKNFDISPKDIGAISATGQMQGCTFIGKDGNAARDSLLWYDLSPIEETADFEKKYNDVFLKECHMKSTTSLTGSKIKWVMNHEPGVWDNVDKFLFASNYITYMLTGNLSVDTNNLGLSGLNNVEKNSWSQTLMDITGVEKSKVPHLTGCFDVVGTVSEKAAKETGLLAGTPVIAGAGDASAECYSIGIAGKSQLKVRLGSAGDIGAVVHESVFAGKELKGMRYVLPEYLYLGNYTKACALSVKWVRETFFRELEKVSEAYAIMDQSIKMTPPGTNDLLYHPYLVGENAPYFDANMTAKYNGICINHTRGDFLKATYEGVAFSIRDLIESMEVLNPFEEILLVGGGAKSKIWGPIMANVLGKNARLPKQCDASYGVALMVGTAIGLFDAEELIENSKKEDQQILFDKAYHEQYNGIFKHYLELAKIK